VDHPPKKNELDLLFGRPLIASPAAPCTACLPMAALAVAFEERIAGCRRGDGHVGGFRSLKEI